jgi:hypothetical protein
LVFLGVKHTKGLENVSKAFSSFGKLGKFDIGFAHDAITTIVVASRTPRNRMVIAMSKLLHVLRKNL